MDKKIDNLDHLKSLQQKLVLKISNAKRNCVEKKKKLRDNLLLSMVFFILTGLMGYFSSMINTTSNLLIVFVLADFACIIIDTSLYVDYKKDKNFYKKYSMMQDTIKEDIDKLENSLGLNVMKYFVNVNEISNHEYAYDKSHRLGIYESECEEKIDKVYRKKK